MQQRQEYKQSPEVSLMWEAIGQSSGRPRQPEFVRQTTGYGNRERKGGMGGRQWEEAPEICRSILQVFYWVSASRKSSKTDFNVLSFPFPCCPSFTYSQMFAEHLLCLYVFTSDSISALESHKREWGRHKGNDLQPPHRLAQKMHDLLFLNASEIEMHLSHLIGDERDRWRVRRNSPVSELESTAM